MGDFQFSTASIVRQTSLSNEDVLRTEVAWHTYPATVISKDQLALVFSIDKKPVGQQAAIFLKKGGEYVDTYTALLKGVNQEPVVIYILTVLEELFTESPAVAKEFHARLNKTNGESDPFAPFLKLLERSSAYVLSKAVVVLTEVLSSRYRVESADADKIFQEHLAVFTGWVVRILEGANPNDLNDSMKVHIALRALQRLCSTPHGREAVTAADGMMCVVNLLNGCDKSSAAQVQVLYQLVFCLWSLSYSKDASAEMVQGGIVGKVVDVLKVTSKEKVLRVCAALLRNLLGVGSASKEMVSYGIMKLLDGFQHRKWADEDVMVDLEHLQKELAADVVNLSSWDVYANEISCGALNWSPCHKSESFWKDHYKEFEKKNGEVLKQLVGHLGSTDSVTLAVACHDVAEFIKVHPDGRRLMTLAGAKPLAMGHLKHSDPEVQKYALMAVQRLMVINWEYLGTKSA
jgi:V-type H+-transporting ATPase subunit H